MRLKSFHGANLTEAMRAVRDALGDNAIIVATREDDQGGVRVTAAIDEQPASARKPAWQAAPIDGTDALESIAEALTRHMVPTALAEKLMATATQFASDDPLLALGAALDTHFKFQPLADDGVTMLVGPPGAGKTLCTAKFATRATLAKRTPTVICTDLERAGAIEQLSAFTRLLNLNLVEIEDAGALQDMIAMQKGNPVLVDTAGCNPFVEAERQALRAFVQAAGDATLTLPAGMDAVEAVELAQEFRAMGASSLLITRVDAVKRLGSVLKTAFDARLPLAYYSASSKVTEAPQPFNPVTLGRLILKDSIQARNGGAASAADVSPRGFSIQGGQPSENVSPSQKLGLRT